MLENPNAIKNLVEKNGTVYFEYHQNQARLEALSGHLLRVTITKDGRWPAHPSVKADPELTKHADDTVATGGSGQRFDAPIVIDHDKQALTLDSDTKTATLGAYQVHLNTSLAISRGSDSVMNMGLPTLEDGQWHMFVKAAENAAYFGGGTRNGTVNLNGQLVAIKNENRWTQGGTASPAPFYWSSCGYGFLANSFTPGEYDFSNSHRGVYLEHEDAIFDAYLILAKTPQQLIQGYHQLTGRPLVPPRFAFYPAHFNAYNRDWWVPVTKDSAGAILFEDGRWYKEYQPISKKTFNTGYRPGTIQVNGLTLVPNVNGNGQVTFLDPDANGMPKTAIHESLNGEHDYQFSARAVIDRYAKHQFPLGWFLPNDGYGAGYGQTDSLAGDLANLKSFADYAKTRGITTGLWTQETLAPKDPAHPLKGERDLQKEVKDAGVRALKTDVAWVGEGYTFGLNATEKAAKLMTKSGIRPMVVTVDGWAGSQRSAFVWSGDQSGSDWQNLRTHIGTYLSSGLSGNPNIASDVDGIYAGDNPLIQTRDLQWKAFTPTFFAMDGWGDQPKNMGQQQPSPYFEINRAYLQLHTMLVPYLYSLSLESAQTGAPIMRPTFWDEANGYTQSPALEDQLLIGDALLLAPIISSYQQQANGDAKRDHVYLPAGKWYSFWSNESLDGSATYADWPAPLTELPVFVKAGSLIPLSLPHQNPAAAESAQLFDYYPGPQFHETLLADDGVSLAYQKGAIAATSLQTAPTDAGYQLTVGAVSGSFAGMAETRPVEFFIVLAHQPQKVAVTIAGKAVDAKMTFGRRRHDPLKASRQQTGLTISLPQVSVHDEIAITITSA